MSYKTTITKLTRELEEQRALRNFKEDAERRIFELQKDNAKKEVEFAEAKETALLANKYHNDLIIAERAIETLEQKVAEYGVELEKGYVAVNQLENYREQLRMKTKEMRVRVVVLCLLIDALCAVHVLCCLKIPLQTLRHCSDDRWSCMYVLCVDDS